MNQSFCSVLGVVRSGVGEGWRRWSVSLTGCKRRREGEGTVPGCMVFRIHLPAATITCNHRTLATLAFLSSFVLVPPMLHLYTAEGHFGIRDG